MRHFTKRNAALYGAKHSARPLSERTPDHPSSDIPSFPIGKHYPVLRISGMEPAAGRTLSGAQDGSSTRISGDKDKASCANGSGRAARIVGRFPASTVHRRPSGRQRPAGFLQGTNGNPRYLFGEKRSVLGKKTYYKRENGRDSRIFSISLPWAYHHACRNCRLFSIGGQASSTFNPGTSRTRTLHTPCQYWRNLPKTATKNHELLWQKKTTARANER